MNLLNPKEFYKECTHSSATPCKSYIECVAYGSQCPQAHGNIEGKELHEKRVKELKYGIEGAKRKILVGMGTCGRAAGAIEVFNILKRKAEKENIKIDMRPTGCIGMCYAEPLIEIIIPEAGLSIFYANVLPTDVDEIFEDTIKGNEVTNRLAVAKRVFRDLPKKITLKGEESVPLLEDIPFMKKQRRDAFENCGVIMPESMEESIGIGGAYTAFVKVLKETTPEQVIETMKKSGLRGRGGAGFPVGMKWEATRKAVSPDGTKYAICNADEGDPGAFMNRVNVEGDPHRVLEGLMIASFAIGAHKAVVYARAEKPLAVARMRMAVKQAYELGILGKNILGTGFDLDVEVREGAGAFVCGEETALMASIEGKRGMPRPRPPFPAQAGLWEKPTSINNVESMAHIHNIIMKGPEWFRQVGTEKSPGTKVFCVTGKVRRTGAIEVPIGTTLREIVFDICGGCTEGEKFKAAQTGGPSGGCIPKSCLDIQLDYETLQAAGSIMGSGGIVIISDKNSMVDIAKYFLYFTQAESCGQCTPCREGTKRLYEILDRITRGDGEEKDLELLKELSETIADTSLCALGKGAPNPVLSTLRYFRDEYEIFFKPSEESKEIVVIDKGHCTGCNLCSNVCKHDAIIGELGEKHEINHTKCVGCGSCIDTCPVGAISRKKVAKSEAESKGMTDSCAYNGDYERSER